MNLSGLLDLVTQGPRKIASDLGGLADVAMSAPGRIASGLQQLYDAPAETIQSAGQSLRDAVVSSLQHSPVSPDPSGGLPMSQVRALAGDPAAIPGLGSFVQAPFSKVMAGGLPKRVFHGSSRAFKNFSGEVADEAALFGPGQYFTESPEVAAGYATTKIGGRIPVPLEDLPEYFKPGNIVPSYGGTSDKVLEFTPGQGPYDWRVKVIGVNPKTGEPLPGELPRVHFTRPELFPEVAPNIRPSYLDVTRPFDMDAPVTSDTLQAIGAAAKKLRMPMRDLDLPALHQEAAWRGGMVGSDVYDHLVGAIGSDWGKTGVNEVLKEAGFDGITHIGGGRTGTDPHRVWISFDPKQIHSAFTPPHELP